MEDKVNSKIARLVDSLVNRAKVLQDMVNESVADPPTKMQPIGSYAEDFPDRVHTVEELREKNGGVWGSHPKFFPEDWRNEVISNNTRLGYWEWVFNQLEMQKWENQ